MSDPTVHPAGPSPVERLVRDHEDRLVAGVCAGLAHHLGVDVTLVRLLTVLGVVLGLGSVGVAYIVAWVLLPTGRGTLRPGATAPRP